MRNNSNKIIPLAIVFGIIWIMISLQDGWGGDHENYVYYFDILKGMSFSDLLSEDIHGAIGYKVFMSIMPSEHFAMAFGMAVWCFAFAFLFYHFIQQKWWFLAIIFVFIDRSIMMGAIASYLRMAIAQSFLVLAFYTKITGKKWWIFIVLLLCGTLFHKSVVFMLPMILIRPTQSKTNPITMMWIFAFLTIFTMLFPSTWIDLVENLIFGSEQLSEYTAYLQERHEIKFKGASLIILFYWLYLLAQQTNKNNLSSVEYLVLKLAMVRIAFDLLPAAGMSVRFFYFIDIYFFAGMMVLFYRLPKNDTNKWFLFLSLMYIFWFSGYRVYASTPFFKDVWSNYNLIF